MLLSNLSAKGLFLKIQTCFCYPTRVMSPICSVPPIVFQTIQFYLCLRKNLNCFHTKTLVPAFVLLIVKQLTPVPLLPHIQNLAILGGELCCLREEVMFSCGIVLGGCSCLHQRKPNSKKDHSCSVGKVLFKLPEEPVSHHDI